MSLPRTKRRIKQRGEKGMKRLVPQITSNVQSTKDPDYVTVKITITQEVKREKVNAFLEKYGAKPLA